MVLILSIALMQSAYAHILFVCAEGQTCHMELRRACLCLTGLVHLPVPHFNWEEDHRHSGDPDTARAEP